MSLPHAYRWTGIALGVAVVLAAGWQWQKLAEGPHTPGQQDAQAPQALRDRAPTLSKPLAGGIPGARNGRPWEDIEGWDALSPRARLTTLFAKPFCLLNNGRTERLELARDELFLPKGPHGSLLKTLPLQADAEALLRQAELSRQETGITPDLVFYLPQMERSEASRRILTDEVLLHVSATGDDAIAAATAVGCEKAHAVKGVSNYVVAKDERMPGSALLAAADLSRHAGIDSARPMVASNLKKMFTPDDLYFKNQWHLKNTHQYYGVAGVDANVTPVWDNYQGDGVVIGILDDSLQTDHPDLQPNYISGPSWNFVPDSSETSPYPVEVGDSHGTCVAGIAAAAGTGVSGVAPRASLAGIRMIGPGSSPAVQMEALGYANDVVAIKNCSWGLPLSTPSQLGVLDPGILDALHDAATFGRGNKGVILTFAAGNDYSNGFQGNKAGFPNNIYVCAVGAVNSSGVRSYYSETGAHLLTCAPSSGGTIDPPITTTDLKDFTDPISLMQYHGYNDGSGNTYDMPDPNYTRQFTGTSAATAVVSGVVALMLQANPDLGWRDVKEILLRSGTKVAPSDADWVSRAGGNATLPPIKHNHQYGGGMINAVNAVNLAKLPWTNLGPMTTLSHEQDFTSAPKAIPDYNTTGTIVAVDFSGDTATRVEQVEVVVDMLHPYRGDVSIDLVSPAGTVSHLAYASNQDDGSENRTINPYGYQGWTFSSARHWGESSLGQWKVIFRDVVRGNTGSVVSLTIKLHGTPCEPVSIPSPPENVVMGVHGTAFFQVGAAGAPNLTYQWSKGTTKITGATSPAYTLVNASLANAGTYSVLVTNLTGQQTCSVGLGMVDTTPHPITINQGATLVLQASAAGPAATASTPGITYLWSKNGVGLTDDPSPGLRITGTQTAKLTVKSVATSDADVYACTVSLGSASLSTGLYTVTVRVKPQISGDFQFAATGVSESVVIPVPITVPGTGIDGFATKFTITGLPSGLTYNSAVGVITGIPNVSGAFVIKIIASNAAGNSVLITPTLTINPLAATTVGTFNGLVASSALGNGNHGGTINLVTKSTGTFTGRLTLGPSAYTLIGRLKATTEADPTVTLAISRGSKVSSLRLLLAIDRTNGHLTGTVDDSTPTFTTPLEAWRNPYSTTAHAGAIATTYNAWMDPPVDGTLPQGASYGTLVVNTLGAATWTGTLADGTAVTRTTTIGPLGDVPLQFMLYGNTGSFQGWLTAALPEADHTYNTLAGTMTWHKNAQATNSTTRSYKSGFAPFALTVTGGQYIKPTPTTVLWGLTDVKAIPGVNNAALTFTDGGLETADNGGELDGMAFRLLAVSTVQLPVANPTVLKLAVNATTGKFAGSATVKNATPKLTTRAIAFSGMIVSGQAKGRGFFTLPGLLPATTTSPILSGAVEMVAPPPTQ